ncbi:hypothetical protein Vretimale_8364 [Volvox reticuliferus]|uniref:Uncharacterized protein n=1 Tax=Volvox reticuliferus TaxID=1737510 RepID=A0A8J4GB41_9CHLO|nr:hypothetical protein Vretimale_8364 [Volvox reticuliferus]
MPSRRGSKPYLAAGIAKNAAAYSCSGAISPTKKPSPCMASTAGARGSTSINDSHPTPNRLTSPSKMMPATCVGWSGVSPVLQSEDSRSSIEHRGGLRFEGK